jgi:FkbM family methyltransferase
MPHIGAFEPNLESYQHLLKNISANALEHVITPHRLAVIGAGEGPVRFPKKSSMYNAIISGNSDMEFEVVATTRLEKMTAAHDKIDLLKLDCEGAEYDILMKSPKGALDKISTIRMEYHLGKEMEVTSFLGQYNFTLCHSNRDSELTGNLWYNRGNQSGTQG